MSKVIRARGPREHGLPEHAPPNLIEVQLTSFRWFLHEGLKELFASFSPIVDFTGNLALSFEDYVLGEPRWTPDDCRDRDATYEAPIKVKVRLVNRETGEVKETEVFLGELPLMTDTGTFIINGAERAVVSQLSRSAGCYFKDTIDISGQLLYAAQLIPAEGPWLDFDADAKGVVSVRIGQAHKFPATTLLRALNSVNLATHSNQVVTSTTADILGLFFDTEAVSDPTPDDLIGLWSAEPIVDRSTGELVIGAYERITEEQAAKICTLGRKRIKVVRAHPLLSATLESDPTHNEEEALLDIYRRERPGDPATPAQARQRLMGLFCDLRRYDLARVGRYMLNRKLYPIRVRATDISSLPAAVRTLTKEDVLAILAYLMRLRDGDETAGVDEIDHLMNKRVRAVGELLQNQFRLGFLRMERIARERMGTLDPEQLTPQAIISTKPMSAAIRSFFGSSQLSQFMDQTNPLAELTHKRRLSALGAGGLSRQSAKLEVRDVHHSHYGRICPIETPEGPNIGLIGSLATHARLDEYGFIETPYVRVVDGRVTDDIVFLSADEEDPYHIAPSTARRDQEGRFVDPLVTVRYRNAFPKVPATAIDLVDLSPQQLVSIATCMIPFLENDDANRALMGSNMQRQAVPLLRAEAPLVKTGLESRAAQDSGAVILARATGKVVRVDAKQVWVQRLDAPSQKATVAGEVVEVPAPPLPGGNGKPSKAVIRLVDAMGQGHEVKLEPGLRPVVERTEWVEAGDTLAAAVDVYNLQKFRRSNQSTCINQRPVARDGQVVMKGAVLADGPSTDAGELALGRNVLVAFMPWEGYNYEDAIVISTRMVREDIFTSVHIEKYEVEARDTKVGPEEITRDIPNVGEEALRDLDEDGIIRIGAQVRAEDVLVGKVAPKGQEELTSEEKLVRAIFGEKAADMRDTSLRVPHGESGKVVDVQQLARFRYRCKKCRTLHLRSLEGAPGHCKHCDHREFVQEEGDELKPGVNQLVRVFVAQRRKIREGDKMAGRHGNKGVIAKVLPAEDMPHLADGTPVDVVLDPLGVPSRMNIGQILETHLGWAAQQLDVQFECPIFEGAREPEIMDRLRGVAQVMLRDRLATALRRDYAAPEVPVAGRTFDEALANLQKWLAEPGEERGAVRERLAERLGLSPAIWERLPDAAAGAALMADTLRARTDQSLGFDHATGRFTLYDGRTGEAFGSKVAVGIHYLMKLAHLVDDKIHARATGPYSLVTQQPLGGKAQFGGQRFGEMEVWALEAYGAAHALQEILTIKSDDVQGRVKTYEAIVKRENIQEPGIPESFKILTKELQSLALSVNPETATGEPASVDIEESEKGRPRRRGTKEQRVG